MQLEKLARRILTFVNIFFVCVFLEAATRALHPVNFREIFKNTFFTEHLWATG